MGRKPLELCALCVLCGEMLLLFVSNHFGRRVMRYFARMNSHSCRNINIVCLLSILCAESKYLLEYFLSVSISCVWRTISCKTLTHEKE